MPLPRRRTERQLGAASSRLGCTVGFALILTALIVLQPTHSTAQDSDPRLFAAHVLDLRAAGVAGEQHATEFLASLPGSGIVDAETLPILWSPFFSNAIVKLGRLHSPGPAALYYDPLLDIAVFTVWKKEGEGYVVASARALPGDRLTKPDASATLLPQWITAEANSLEALARLASARLESFHQAHPAESQEAGRATSTFAADAADMRAVLPRLAWNAALRLEWTDGTQPWLPTTLTAIQTVLDANNPSTLLEAAPDTDAETAAALTDLPPAFADGLALDMMLEAGELDRILIGSLPEDGDIYVLVYCRLEGSGCTLRRIMLISLLG